MSNSMRKDTKNIRRGRPAIGNTTQNYSPQQFQQQTQRRSSNQQQFRPQGFGQQFGGKQPALPQLNLSSDDEDTSNIKGKQRGVGLGNEIELSDDDLAGMPQRKKSKTAPAESTDSSDEDSPNQGDVVPSALPQSKIPNYSGAQNNKAQNQSTTPSKIGRGGKNKQQSKGGKSGTQREDVFNAESRLPQKTQQQESGTPTPNSSSPPADSSNQTGINLLADSGEATVYKLSTGDTSNGGTGEEFFVELKAYANVRQERDHILSEYNKAKSDGTLISGKPDAFLDSIQSALLMDKGGQCSVSLNGAREIVQQRQGHRVIQELCKKILAQEEDTNSARVDAGWMKSMSQKIKELEESNQNLNEMNNVVKQANVDLTIESKRKIDDATNEAKQAAAIEKKNLEISLTRRIQELERSNIQLQEMKQNVEKANADLITQSASKQDELMQALNDARKNGPADKNQIRTLQRKVQELDNYNRQLQELNASVKQANADLTNESREKLEIALEEVKKANAAEKALKLEKRNFVRELETSKKVTNSLNEQLADLRNRNTIQEEKIKELEVEAKQASEENETTKNLRESYQGLYRSNQSRLAEISQLKIVIDRISRENTMWSSEIKESRGKMICKFPEHANRDNCFVKVREAYLDNHNVDPGSRKTLPDGAVSDLVIDVLKEHVGMKRHYASEIMNSVDKLRKLGRKVHEKDQESAAYEKLAAQKDNAVSMLNKKLLSTIGDLKSKAENVDGMNKKCQLWSDRANRTMKEVEMLKKLIEPEKQKSEKLDQMYKKSKQESEVLKTKLVSAVKEIENYKELKTKAAAQFANMKEDFKTLQKDAVQLKNNLSKAVEKIKDLQGNQISNRESKIEELNKGMKEVKAENEQLKKDKADLNKKIKWAREHVTALDSKHNQLEHEVNKGKNLNTEIYWERTQMEEDLKKAQQNVAKLEAQIVTMQKNANSSDKNNEKVLKELLAKKDEELQKTKGETANFQLLMKKDLEKIKQMSLAHTTNKDKDAKELKECRKEIDELKKANEEHKLQVQILEGYNRQLRQNKGSTAPPPGLPSVSNGFPSADGDRSLPVRSARALTTPPDSAKKTTAKNLFNKERSNTSKAKSKDSSGISTKVVTLKQEKLQEQIEEEDSDIPVSPPKSSQSPEILNGGEGTDSWANIQLPLQ